MVVISKHLFNQLVDNESCNVVMHPDFKGCLDCSRYFFIQTVQGVFKFYLAVFFVELLIHHKKIKNKEFLKKQLRNLLKSWSYGIAMSNMLVNFQCLSRRIMGRYYYYTTIFVPGILSGFSIFLENPKMRILNMIFFSTLTLQCGINNLKGEEIISNSVNVDTIYFMITNALFMYLYKTNIFAKKATLFWFFDPRPTEDKKSNNCCKGNYKCFQHILEDSLKTFRTGYALYSAKTLIGNIKNILKNPLHILKVLLTKRAIYNGLFFGLYVFIYEMTCRFLYEKDQGEKGYHPLFAGFLAGLSYRISPSMQMNLLPLVLTMQLLWINLREVYKIPRWIIPELFFGICCGTIFHFRFIKAEYCPKYVSTLVNDVVNGKGYMLTNSVNNFIERKIKEKGIPITKNMYVTGFK